MAKNGMYYQLAVNQQAREADLDIYGDITSWAGEWSNEEYGDMSAHLLSKRLAELGDVDTINVNINSYGGEVAEGLAIYNALMRHPAAVRTRVDGFACSIASVIFMAGDVREMSPASLLMIHNAWQWASGNAAELRKAADDLETITAASKAAYMGRVSIGEERLTELMDAETWLLAADAIAYGFATELSDYAKSDSPSQSARGAAMGALAALASAEPAYAEQEEPEPEPDHEPGEEPETDGEPPIEAEPEAEPVQEEPARHAAAANFAAFLLS